jgi:hypothetical protein
MRLDAQHDRELAKRKGLAKRTIIAFIWLAFCTLFAYYLADLLFENEYLDYRWFHSVLFVPWDWDNWIIFAGVVAFIVFVMNFILLIGYAFFSAAGRRRPGTASLYSSDPDPDDKRFDYH